MGLIRINDKHFDIEACSSTKNIIENIDEKFECGLDKCSFLCRYTPYYGLGVKLIQLYNPNNHELKECDFFQELLNHWEKYGYGDPFWIRFNYRFGACRDFCKSLIRSSENQLENYLLKNDLEVSDSPNIFLAINKCRPDPKNKFVMKKIRAESAEISKSIIKKYEFIQNVDSKYNIIIYGLFQKESFIYLLMPVYDFNLEKAMSKGIIKPDNTTAFELIFSLLNSCKDLHAIPIIHRDIKPSNIFLKPIGHKDGYFFVLADFDIAKYGSDNSCRFVTGGTGTYCFMSPEQMIEFKAYPESDVWGIGVTLVYFLTGNLKSWNMLSVMPNYIENLKKELQNFPLFEDLLIGMLQNKISDRLNITKCFDKLSVIEKKIFSGHNYSEPCRCSDSSKSQHFTD